MANKKTRITIIGSGYVGLPLAAILANCGYDVAALEINPERLNAIKAGKSFFYETGLEPLIQSAIEKGNLTATDSYEQVVPASDIVFSSVGTPDNPDGSSNLTYVFSAAESAAKLMKSGSIFVQKSTVPVGTGAKLEKYFKAKGIGYVSNPEFLREGTAVSDSLWFDRAVAGSNDKLASAKVLDIYKSLVKDRNKIAAIAGLAEPTSIPVANYINTTLASAELIKVTANAFLALKISFANSIAKLADQAGADITEVMDGIGADRRIGRAFLNAGRGYGGGCFPKDVSGLLRSAEDYGVELGIMEAASEANAAMPHYIINKAAQKFGSSISGKNVAVLGLAFKAGTSDTRRSPAIAIANTLAESGAAVAAYDPEAEEEAKTDLDKRVILCDEAEQAYQNAEVVFVATDWPEFKSLDFGKVKLVVDCMNCLPDKVRQKLGSRYVGVGR